MPSLKATFFLLLVLLPSCNARHFEGTDEDSANGDNLSLDVQEKREDETKSEDLDNAEKDSLVRRVLNPSSHKRQDDMPGIWGRSIESKDLAKTNGDDMHAKLVKLDESEEDEERQGEGAEVWGRAREFGNKLPKPAALWERGIENKQPPGLWGREFRNQPPGLWGRELWGREALAGNQPPGLWGREMSRVESWGDVDDKDEVIHDDK